MRLSGKIDQVLTMFLIISVALVMGVLISAGAKNTFAESEEGIYQDSAEHFVTFYNNGEKLTVKTDATTVKDALDRAGYKLNPTDVVEPSLETKIDSDFFINIYPARPVLVRDGGTDKYLMSASYDKKIIAREAGLTIYDGDEISLVRNNNFLEAGAVSVYEVTRNGGRTITEEEEIAFNERTVKDYNLAPGTKEIRQLGEVGLKTTVYNVLFVDNKEVSREKMSETVVREPVERIVAVGASAIEKKPLTAGMGRNRYTVTKPDGTVIERQETFYDLDMGVVISFCGSSYSIREDGVKVDQDGYVLVAADLTRYPRCSVVETSLGAGKVYDTGTFVLSNPEQFDIATDWTNHNGR